MKLGKQTMKPFLKWAGGKQRLTSTLLQYAPKHVNSIYSHFLGAGSFELALSERFPLSKVYAYDINKPLILTWDVIKNGDINGLIAKIEDLKVCFDVDKQVYYEVREKFNNLIANSETVIYSKNSIIDLAAMFIFLNRCGYNGMYRVNSKGAFNVPVGKHKGVYLPSKQHLQNIKAVLQRWDIQSCDFLKTTTSPNEGDLVYHDPPHFGTFDGYSKDQWKENQDSLLVFRQVYEYWSSRGVNIMHSNADCGVVRSVFEGFYITPMSAKTSLGCKQGSRGSRAEVLITNYR